jgi:hypothetical protein
MKQLLINKFKRNCYAFWCRKGTKVYEAAVILGVVFSKPLILRQLTNTMELSPYREATSRSATQECPNI